MGIFDKKKKHSVDHLLGKARNGNKAIRIRRLGRYPFPKTGAPINLVRVFSKEELGIHDYSKFANHDRKTGLFRKMLKGWVLPSRKDSCMDSTISETTVPMLLKATNTEDSLTVLRSSPPEHDTTGDLGTSLRSDQSGRSEEATPSRTRGHIRPGESIPITGGDVGIAGGIYAIREERPVLDLQLPSQQVSAKFNLWVRDRDGPNVLLYASDDYQLHQLHYRIKKVQQPINRVDQLFPDSSSPYLRQRQHGGVSNYSGGNQRTADTGNSSKTSKRKADSHEKDEKGNSEEAGEGGEHPAKRHNSQLDPHDLKLPCLHYKKASNEAKEDHGCKNMQFKTITEQISHLEDVHGRFACLLDTYHNAHHKGQYLEEKSCGKLFETITSLKRHTQNFHIRAVCCEECCENYSEESITNHRKTHAKKKTRLRHRAKYGPVLDFSAEVSAAKTAVGMWQTMFDEQGNAPKYDVLSEIDRLEGNASDGCHNKIVSDIIDDIEMLNARISTITKIEELCAIANAFEQNKRIRDLLFILFEVNQQNATTLSELEATEPTTYDPFQSPPALDSGIGTLSSNDGNESMMEYVDCREGDPGTHQL